MYSIEFSKNSKKFLKKISDKNRERIIKKIYSIRKNPFSYFKKLQGNKLWRLRVLKYRAVIDVIVSGKRIIVLRIGHRKNVY